MRVKGIIDEQEYSKSAKKKKDDELTLGTMKLMAIPS